MIQQYVDAWDLFCALDESCDGDVDDETMWDWKLFDIFSCPETLVSLMREQLDPICVVVENGRYGAHFIQGNGHHRLALALIMERDVLVLFNDEDEDWMCSYITDANEGIEFDG